MKRSTRRVKRSKRATRRKFKKQRGGSLKDVAPGYTGTVVAKPAWDDLTSRIGDPDEIPTLMSSDI
jgi:hypothetical protein